jgi:cytochrome c-type biogenesis protein CcmH
MIFWLIALGIAGLVAATLFLTLVRPRDTVQSVHEFDVNLYKNQLSEIDRDLARGILSETDAERLRVDISRRILQANKSIANAENAIDRKPRLAFPFALTLAAVAGAFWVYTQIGAAGYPDFGIKTRLDAAKERYDTRKSQEEAVADMPAPVPPTDMPENFMELMTQLRAAVEKNPNDLRGLEFLAGYEARLNNFTAAAKAQGRIIGVKGDDATADDYLAYAQFQIFAAGGYVSPEAESVLRATLDRDPQNPGARYFMGVMFLQNMRPDTAYRAWRPVLDNPDAAENWKEAIKAEIEDVAMLAGVEYTPPSTLRGPSQEDMQAAGNMSAEDRQAMIRGMVDQLSDRLATEGGSPEEWARLINALGVLGKTDRAKAIWSEARGVFAGSDRALTLIDNAAKQAGVSE